MDLCKANKFCELEEIFEKENVPLPEIPAHLPLAACHSLNALLSDPDFIAFLNLAESEQAPYLQIHPPAIAALLQGLMEQQLDKTISEKGLENLLRASYDKILLAVRKALNGKDDLVTFRNQIECIHQEIQTFLIFLEPYNEDGDFSKALLRNMSSILPENAGEARVHLKPSAMRVFSSVLAGLERQKQSSKLNILVHKDCYYYETDSTLRNGKNQYSTTVMNSEHYMEGRIEQCFMSLDPKPFDLLVMEYNHNISEQRIRYQKENIIGQMKELRGKGLLGEKCTVLIDTTISLERATELKELFFETMQNAIDESLKDTEEMETYEKDMLAAEAIYHLTFFF